MPRRYFLSSIAVSHLREHKRWSIARFGQAITKKYFEDLDKAFQYIADHYASLPARKELTGDSGLGIHPIREHFVIFLPLRDGVHIVDVLRQSQDVPNIIRQSAAIFEREILQNSYLSSSTQ